MIEEGWFEAINTEYEYMNMSTQVFKSSVKNPSLWISGYVMAGITVEAVQMNAKTVLFHEDMSVLQ